MERLHYDLTNFEHVPLFKDSDLKDGFFLCVLHANKVPPHLGITINGKFYSLKAKGKDVNIPIDRILQVLRKKTIVGLFVKLDPSLVTEEKVKKVFGLLPNSIEGKQTCLAPIKEIVDAPEDVEHIGDLLSYLESDESIIQRITINLPVGFKGIPWYSLTEIKQRIEFLKNDKGRKNNP
jgi:hypothetical protein